MGILRPMRGSDAARSQFQRCPTCAPCHLGLLAHWSTGLSLGRNYIPNAYVVTQGGKAQRFYDDLVNMRRQNDPRALALVARFPTVRMPPMSISENDAADLLAYIDARRPPTFSLAPLAALTTHKGTHFSLDLVKSQPIAVAFGFTHCPDVCPTTLLDWSNVRASLGPDGDRLKVLLISVDTQRDTPEALNAYMASFDPRIIALAGSSAAVYRRRPSLRRLLRKGTRCRRRLHLRPHHQDLLRRSRRTLGRQRRPKNPRRRPA
jgi:hypothetical protein